MHNQDKQNQWIEKTFNDRKDEIQAPEHLDSVILAAAKKSCLKQNISSKPLILRREWQCLFAFAASIVVVITINFFYSDAIHSNEDFRIRFDSEPVSQKFTPKETSGDETQIDEVLGNSIFFDKITSDTSANPQKPAILDIPATGLEMEEKSNMESGNNIEKTEIFSRERINYYAPPDDFKAKQKRSQSKTQLNNENSKPSVQFQPTRINQPESKKPVHTEKEFSTDRNSKNDNNNVGLISSDNKTNNLSGVHNTNLKNEIYPDRNNKDAWINLYQQLKKEGDQEKIQAFLTEFRINFPNENPELLFIVD